MKKIKKKTKQPELKNKHNGKNLYIINLCYQLLH